MIDGTAISASYDFHFILADIVANGDLNLSKTSKKGPKIWQDYKKILKTETDREFFDTINNLCNKFASDKQVSVADCSCLIKGVKAQFAASVIKIIDKGNPNAQVIDATNFLRRR
jgi:hypothetical protein